MKPAPFDYVAPRTIDEACNILAEADGGATLLAGGQTLMPLLALYSPGEVFYGSRLIARRGEAALQG